MRRKINTSQTDNQKLLETLKEKIENGEIQVLYETITSRDLGAKSAYGLLFNDFELNLDEATDTYEDYLNQKEKSIRTRMDEDKEDIYKVRKDLELDKKIKKVAGKKGKGVSLKEALKCAKTFAGDKSRVVCTKCKDKKVYKAIYFHHHFKKHI